MEDLSWKETQDGGAELKTGALNLVVRPHAEGWECVAYNAGRYKALYRSTFIGDLTYVKRMGARVAYLVLKDEMKALEPLALW